MNLKVLKSVPEEMLFVFEESQIPKTKDEIRLEREVKRLNEVVYGGKSTPKARADLRRSLENLGLEQMIREAEAYNLYIGRQGALSPAEILDFDLAGKEVCSVNYRLRGTEGKLILSPQSEYNHEYFAMHGRNKLSLTRVV